ncbi:amidase family protein [Algoriphagus sp. CAU 1675]|uniref:amidase family protein n=1 Tax=Algoriphagus sp. CAU 1675 TaxID=3032597 RepID=UPI0023DA6099|nr:amidase family protein [Algoriphagus sp. CAU 1675]MDF2156700.1 amidase family protein [Algoriphagus sp. CAU 1675]
MKNWLYFTLFFALHFSCSEKKVISLEELTIAEIHQAYTEGDYNAEELVQAYLDRIQSKDSAINSISEINPQALEDARKLDNEFAQTGKLRPLHGIPVIVKDNINTLGLPTTAGALALADFFPESDAFIIQKLKEAGAIVLAKSNMAEWAFSPMHSESSTKGTTHNPYNLEHVPAGSSGGTGAAVAANLGTVGLGTDTGNSIRGPSSHNSLVGFRTTLGLISREGIVPLYLRNDVVGPMCRTVEDATRMLDVIAGYDAKDPITRHSEGKIPTSYTAFLKKDGLENARIGVFRTLSENDPNPEISALFNQALKDMEGLGAVIVDSVEVANFQELRQNQWCASFRQDLEDFLATYVKRDTVSTLEDVIRIGTKSDYTRSRIDLFLTNEGRWEESEIPCGDAFTDLRRIAFREAIEHVMDSLNLDALVYPSWNHPAARIDHFQEEYKGDNSQIIAPHTGQPAFTVPMGFVSGNLPAGLQFLGRMFDEPKLIQLVYGFEQGTHHRKAPH